MGDYRYDYDDEVASVSRCPIPECGALAVAFTPPDRACDSAELREFTCPRCGSDFSASDNQLIFQSVPKRWLLARVQAA